jgi:prepilin-type processing-associated H-X9-DG protein
VGTGDRPAALVAANRVLDINPHYAMGHYVRGVCLRDTKDLQGAIASFQRAADLDPGFVLACWNLGDVFRLQGNGAAAADAYRKAADRAVDREQTAVSFRKLGTCLRDLKDLQGAVSAFQRAIDIDPEDFQARHSLGQVLQQQGRHADAEQALKPIKAQPTTVRAYDLLARLLATCPDDKARDGKRAVEYATTACERTEWKNPLYLDTLATAYAEAGQFDEAVRYQFRALDAPALRGDLRTAARQRLESYGPNTGTRGWASRFDPPQIDDGVFLVLTTQSVRIADITDGTSSTILFGETYYRDPLWKTFSDQCLWAPSQHLDDMTQMAAWNSYSSVARNATAQINWTFAPSDVAGPFPGPWTPPCYNLMYKRLGAYGSGHGGGANVVMADGSVHFLRDSLSLATLQALSTRAGGEVIAEDY